jgi:hypothetical protein
LTQIGHAASRVHVDHVEVTAVASLLMIVVFVLWPLAELQARAARCPS